MSSARENPIGASAQRDLYGATWQERFSAIRRGYGLSQHALAATIGLSAPMVSQLSSGQRTKIANPAVLARVTLLEDRLADAAVRAGDEAAIAAVLAEAVGSHPVLTTQSAPASARATTVQWLGRHASAAQLSSIAEAARARGAEELADALTDAART